MDRKFSTLEYNNSKVNNCFNHLFTYEFDVPALNLHLITIDYRPRPHERSHYTPDLIPDAISVASEDYFSTLTTPSVFSDILPYSDTKTLHVMNKYLPFLGMMKI